MSDNYIQAFKGYDRAGSFPLEKYSRFSTEAEALDYAKGGATKRTSAYVGQRISIVGTEESFKVRVYVIDNKYDLVAITGSATSGTDSYIVFGANTESGTVGFTLDQGAYVESVTVSIEEAFENDGAFTIGKEEEQDFYIGEDDILTNEEGTYTVNINKKFETQERILIWFHNRGTKGIGKAILKIN